MEGVIGTSKDDTLTGDDFVNVLEGGKGVVARVRSERLQSAHPLLGVQDLAVVHSSGYGGVVAGDRIDIFDGRVGAIR